MEDRTRGTARKAATAGTLRRRLRRDASAQRQLLLAVWTILLTINGAWHDLEAQTGTAIPRVRSSNQVIGILIDQATRRSETFRGLVTTIMASDGIVYVEPGRCGHGVRACLVTWMHVSGATRFLRILIQRSTSDTDAQVIAALGHELQHTIEVLIEPSVKDGVTMFNYLKRTAPTDNNRFETTEAINAGNAVYDEVRSDAEFGH